MTRRQSYQQGYVSKPISVIRFVEAVADLLRAAEERRGEEEATAVVPEAVPPGVIPVEEEVPEQTDRTE